MYNIFKLLICNEIRAHGNCQNNRNGGFVRAEEGRGKRGEEEKEAASPAGPHQQVAAVRPVDDQVWRDEPTDDNTT